MWDFGVWILNLGVWNFWNLDFATILHKYLYGSAKVPQSKTFSTGLRTAKILHIISPKSTWNISTTDTRHFILDPSTHTQENSPSYEFRLPKSRFSEVWRVWHHFPKVYLKHINHRHSRHFILDPSTHTHTQENSPSYEFRLPKVKVFWSMKGLTSFPQSLPETYQPQTLEAFHPRPFHPHPHPGKLTKLWIQTSKSQGFLKYEGSDIISPKSTWNISTTDTRGISS